MNSDRELEQAELEVAAGKLSDAAATCLGILRREPDNVRAMALYGGLAMDMQQNAAATIILQKLLEVEPLHADSHGRLAMLYQQVGDYPAAREHAHIALQLNSRSVVAQTVIANILLAEKREQEALEAFDRARKISPGNLGIESAYADALLETGQFTRAADVIRALLVSHPNDTSLVLRLAGTRKWQAEDPDIQFFRAMLDAEDEPLPEIAADENRLRAALSALFKLESDLGNLDKAFAYLMRRKEVCGQSMEFDPQQSRDNIDTLKSLFTANFMADREGLGCDSTAPIFVVGMPRSGTTLLERVLSSAKNIVPAGELIIAQRLREEVCAHFGDNQYDLKALAKVPDKIWNESGEEYVRRAWKRLPDGEHFVDKMPDNYKQLGFIKAMLPRARIIHITRHPVANCLSIFEQDFSGGHYYSNRLDTLGDQYLLYRDLMAHWNELFGEHIVEVRYEDLVSNTAHIVAELNRQLDLDIDLNQFENSQQAGEIRTASRWQARQGIHTDSIERWRKLGDRLEPLLDALSPILDEEDLR